jgi:flagellin-specific chaperone FliS
MNYFTRYETTKRASLTLFEVFELIVEKTQNKIMEAITALERKDTLGRVKACSEAAFNLSLIVHAIDQGSLEGDGGELYKIKRSCSFFVEMISRANIQENKDLFESIYSELHQFKEAWHHAHHARLPGHPSESSYESYPAMGV